jgi:ABC-2 type transport system permease protein
MATITDNTGAYHAMIMLLNLPLLFLSNALYPLETMPTWMRIGAMINPTTYVVTGLRYLLIENGTELARVEAIPLWLCFVAIAIFAVLGMWWASSTFKKSFK